ncbi:hypothetical protein [Algiphilus sp.]|uniref:hypothetical protein n=1 Tax=Algiphilus sp. TaxID=1872431 RepID=UPI0025BAC6B7|nr:hypothetical protein [Algiphilus sp.]MCK5772036.1 hypothetical protein [Algiphilus sp.]
MLRTTVLALTGALVACGGGSDGGGEDPLFDEFSAYAGGHAYEGSRIASGSPGYAQGCGVQQPLSRSRARGVAQEVGLTVVEDNEYSFRATGPGGAELALFRAGETIVLIEDDGHRNLEILLPLPGSQERWGLVDVEGNDEPALFALWADDRVTESTVNAGTCPARGPQPASAIRGAWLGERYLYNPETRIGAAEPAELNCNASGTGTTCSFSDREPFAVSMRAGSDGIWTGNTSSDAVHLMGAVMSPEGGFVTAFRCPESAVGDIGACMFYTFARVAQN